MSEERSQYPFVACMDCMKLYEVPRVFDDAGMHSEWKCAACGGELEKIGVLMYGRVASDFEHHARYASEPMYRKSDMVREAWKRRQKEEADAKTKT